MKSHRALLAALAIAAGIGAGALSGGVSPSAALSLGWYGAGYCDDAEAANPGAPDGCRYGAEADCGNGVDDDSDERTDCLDPDCLAPGSAGAALCATNCVPMAEICGDNVDQDCDGSDAACACDWWDPSCWFGTGPTCGDGRCDAGESCQADCGAGAIYEVCGDLLDNDGDGAADCGDTDCGGDPACAVSGGGTGTSGGVNQGGSTGGTGGDDPCFTVVNGVRFYACGEDDGQGGVCCSAEYSCGQYASCGGTETGSPAYSCARCTDGIDNDDDGATDGDDGDCEDGGMGPLSELGCRACDPNNDQEPERYVCGGPSGGDTTCCSAFYSCEGSGGCPYDQSSTITDGCDRLYSVPLSAPCDGLAATYFSAYDAALADPAADAAADALGAAERALESASCPSGISRVTRPDGKVTYCQPR